MYYLGKIIQATGLAVVFINFVSHFPRLMNFKTFLLGTVIFTIGWIINQFFLQK